MRHLFFVAVGFFRYCFSGLILGLEFYKHGLGHSLLEDYRIELFLLLFESAFNKLLELLALEPVSDSPEDLAQGFLPFIEFPVVAFNHTFVLLLDEVDNGGGALGHDHHPRSASDLIQIGQGFDLA